MARYKLIRPVLGFPAGTTIADSYFALIPGDVLCPALCQRPDINIMTALDASAVTNFAAVGIVTHEGWQPEPEKGQ
jgi:hypothetical protein